MLNLYQDIFEGHGATCSWAFTSLTIGDEDDMEEEEPPNEMSYSGEEDESMFVQGFHLP